MLEIRRPASGESKGPKAGYERIYSAEGIHQLGSFYRWLLRVHGIEPGIRILDVACGEGRLANLAAAAGMAAFGVDFSASAVRLASHQGGAHFVVADGERLPYADCSFDSVTSIGSLEHYEDPAQGLREIARLLTPRGRALVLLPNTFGILHNVWTSLRSGRTGQDDQPIQRYAARHEWQDMLEAAGLFVTRVVKYERELPTSWVDAAWYLRHPKELIRLLLTPLVPLTARGDGPLVYEWTYEVLPGSLPGSGRLGRHLRGDGDLPGHVARLTRSCWLGCHQFPRARRSFLCLHPPFHLPAAGRILLGNHSH
jgi:SAM-dependent methyltransferase